MIKNDSFVKDGQTNQHQVGQRALLRVPRAYWRDRLERAKALGLNAITTYVPWNFHEDVEGRFDFAEATGTSTRSPTKSGNWTCC